MQNWKRDVCLWWIQSQPKIIDKLWAPPEVFDHDTHPQLAPSLL